MFPTSSKLANEPILLSGEQAEDPYKIIEEFFDDMKLAEIRQDLANQLETCLTTDNTFFASPEQRADLIHRYHRLTELLEAVNRIVQEDRSEWFRMAS